MLGFLGSHDLLDEEEKVLSMNAHEHTYVFVPTEPATWGNCGGDPEVPAHWKCECGHEDFSGDPEAEEAANRADWQYDLARDLKDPAVGRYRRMMNENG